METRGVDSLLNYRLILVYPGSQAVATFSRKMNFSFQSALHFGEEDLELSYFIPEELSENREVSILLAQTNATKDENLYFLRSTLSDPGMFTALTNLARNAKSVVIDNLVLHRGDYYLSARFHESDLNLLSSGIMKYATRFDGLGISYLGANPGICNTLEDIHRGSGLVRIEWQAEVPGDDKDMMPFCLMGDEWFSEIRYMTKSNRVSQLFRTVKPLDVEDSGMISVISEKENLYEVEFQSDGSYIGEYHASSYNAKLVRFGRMIHYKDGVMKTSGVVPRVQSKIAIQVLAHCRERFPEWNVRMNSIMDFKAEP